MTTILRAVLGVLCAAAVCAAQSTPVFRIVVIEGEDAVNIIQQKTAVRPLIEVRDSNSLPVAGVPVTFSVAGSGASFAGGAQSITVLTNAAGQAAATGFTPTAVGAVQIQATAAIQGQTAIATITQTNVLTAAQAAAGATAAAGGAGAAAGAGGVSTGVVAGIIGGGAAAVGGTVAATRGGSSSDGGGSRPTSTTPPATTTVDDRPPTPTTPTPPTTDPRPPTTTPTPPPDPRPPDPTPPTTPTPRPDDVACTFNVDPKSIRAGGVGGTERVTVTYMPRDCTNRRWIVTNVPSFVEATPLEGEGDGSVTLRVAAHNGNFERTDAISIAGNVISISQPPRTSLAMTCVPELRRGANTGEIRTFELGATAGTVPFTFSPGARSENRLIVSYEGRPLFDSGCGAPPAARTLWLTYAGRSSSITVHVQPNCDGGSSSHWEYQLSCPLQQ